MSKNLTCCTKKMEERYQLAARRDMQSLLQTSSSGLKLLFSRNVAAFQGKPLTANACSATCVGGLCAFLQGGGGDLPTSEWQGGGVCPFHILRPALIWRSVTRVHAGLRPLKRVGVQRGDYGAA